MIPHLTTALTGPLQELEKRVLESSTVIEHWFRGKWQDHTPPFYCSVDLRNSGFKLSPVDTNLFPGGFNNLNPAFIPRNHLVVEVIDAAVKHGDFAPFERLVQVLARPYDDQPEAERYTLPPHPHEVVEKTFCGT